MHWNFELEIGNPTKLTNINNFIKAVVRKGTQQEGRNCKPGIPLKKKSLFRSSDSVLNPGTKT
jgi:hypothetical protein